MYWLPARILVRNDYYCIVYAYDNDVFSPDSDRTIECLSAVRDGVLNEIRGLKAQGYQEFSIFGFSLGTMIAFMVADRSRDVGKIIVNLTSTDPAEAVWTWDHINVGFKQGLLEQHLTLDKLRRLWAPIAPVHNMSHLQGKQILIYLAKHDRLLPHEQAKEIVNLIRRAGYDFQVVINKYGGHTLAGIWNLINARIYLRFLKNKS